ncbi:MAG: thioredoxin domain-containing protein [Bacteroidota bacterium]
MMKVVLISMFLVVSQFAVAQPTNLTAAQFEAGIRNLDSVQLLDVRTPAEYQAGHLDKALLADWKDEKEFQRRINFIDKAKPVYVYCLGGGRSAAAAEKMRALGFTNVFELVGGINAWKAAEKPVVGRSGQQQLSVEDFDKSLQTPGTILVDFGAEWCPPCKLMEPVLANLQNTQAGKFTLVKVDGGRDEAVMKKYNVTALPVFIIFKNGKQVWRKEGLVAETELAELLR